jgi:hypothetical protein
MEHALDEQETTFIIEATDRYKLSIYSNDSVWIKRLEELGIEPSKENEYGKWYQVSLKDFNFGLRKKRQLAAEERDILAERMRRLRHEQELLKQLAK